MRYSQTSLPRTDLEQLSAEEVGWTLHVCWLGLAVPPETEVNLRVQFTRPELLGDPLFPDVVIFRMTTEA